MNKLITSMIYVFTISTASCSTPDTFSGVNSYTYPPISEKSAQKKLFNQIEQKLGIRFYYKNVFTKLRPFLPVVQALMRNILSVWKEINIEDLADYISGFIVQAAGVKKRKNIPFAIRVTLIQNAYLSDREEILKRILICLPRPKNWLNNNPIIIEKKGNIKKLVDMYLDIIQLSNKIRDEINSDSNEAAKKEEISNLLIQYKDCFSPLNFPDEVVQEENWRKHKFKNPLIGMHQLACWLRMAQNAKPTIQEFMHGKSKDKNLLHAVPSPSGNTPSLLSQLLKGSIEKSDEKLIECMVDYIWSTGLWKTLDIKQEEFNFLLEKIVDRESAWQRKDKQFSKIEDDYIAPYVALLAGKTYDQLAEVESDLGTIKKSAEERTSFPIKRPVSDIGNIEDPRNPKRNESNRRMHLIEHEMNSDEQEDPLPPYEPDVF